MPASEDPVRRQLIDARRAQIIGAAAKVFAEKGFHRATTKEIARAAGVSEGTIYNYFDSKAGLLIGLMTRLTHLDHLGGELTDALQSDVRDFFVDMFRCRLEIIRQNHETIQAVLPEMLVNPALRERFYRQFVAQTTALLEQYVQARIDRGEVQPVDVPLTVRAVQSMFVGVLILRILGDEVLLSRWDDMPEVLAALVFDGLGAAHGG
jgi:TetR/AcrR family fatty acid metabolism transcriptional regulator